MPHELIALGVIGYLGSVSLAVLWAAIAFAYMRGGKPRMTWCIFCASMLIYAIIFAGLALISLEPSWMDRQTQSVIQRTAGILAAATGWIYTALTLRDEFKAQNRRKDN